MFGSQKIENKYSDPSKFAICVFRNRMKKSRALKKLKESLPASPSKRCVVISTYLSRRSPEFPTVLILRKSISPVDSVMHQTFKK